VNLLKRYRQKLSEVTESLTYLRRAFILSPQSSKISLKNNSIMSASSLSQKEITAMLRAWGEGERGASEELVRLVYNELRRQARFHLRRERSNHTLQTTALINEAYIKLVEQRSVNRSLSPLLPPPTAGALVPSVRAPRRSGAGSRSGAAT